METFQTLSRADMKNVIGGMLAPWSGTCTFYGADGKPIKSLTVKASDNDGGHSSQCLADLACSLSNACSNVDCAGSAAGCNF